MSIFRSFLKPIALILPTIIASFLFFTPKDVYAVGITPAKFDVKGILQNSSVPQTVYFSRRNPSRDEDVYITVTGTAAGYIKIPNDGKFMLPKGNNTVPYVFTIESGSLAPGLYEARLAVNQLASPEDSTAQPSGSGSSVLFGAETIIHFTVTGEARESLSFDHITFRDTEITLPVPYTFRIINTGNVDSRPSKIDITMTNDADPSLIYKETLDMNSIAIVKAFVSNELNVVTETKLPLGNYHAVIEFYVRDQLALTSEKLGFRVLPPETLVQKGELKSFVSDKQTYNSREPVTFTGAFQNTGTLVVNAALDITIVQDGKTIDTLRSEETTASINQSVILTKIYHPLTPGTYTAIGRGAFGSNKSNEISIEFTVNAKPSILNVNNITMFFLGLLLFILLLILILLIIKRSKKEKQPPTIPPLPTNPSVPAPRI